MTNSNTTINNIQEQALSLSKKTEWSVIPVRKAPFQTSDCYDCHGTERKYRVKLIPTNSTRIYFPKFIPQVSELCADCGRWIKFATQKPELIDELNKKLKELTL
jgi:hypothetical protein